IAAKGTFDAHPAYLHDWHLFAIAALSIVVLGIYFLAMFSRTIFKNHPLDWPLPLVWSLPFWLGLYIGFMLLSLISNSFSWGFFIVMGLSYALFASWRLIIAISIVFVTFCLFQGILTLPVSKSDFGSLFGIGIAFFSFTAFAMVVQRLISERYERNQLIQELAQAHSELEEAHRRLAESVAQEQELAVLRERTRLAREMHDTVGHALVLISIKLEAARRLRERDPQRCDQELEATGEIARATMNDLRVSIADLRSPALEREPASRALASYAREMAQRAGLHVTCDLHPDIEGLSAPVEETLWKVGQEALTNVEKHARARNVALHISRQDGSIVMRVQDDGVGLPLELRQCQENGDHTCASPEGHYGLSGMYERVASIGGHISLESTDSSDSHGTVVKVALPLVEAPLRMSLL
ncbi:MAG TPA: sensor histidine kinase, partial [Ktedonobacteraceae bacterium]|nr:sensor histidine kinase [Ktedonobacteraceae bacterium]